MLFGHQSVVPFFFFLRASSLGYSQTLRGFDRRHSLRFLPFLFDSPGRSPAAGGNPRHGSVHQLVLERVQMRKAEGGTGCCAGTGERRGRAS